MSTTFSATHYKGLVDEVTLTSGSGLVVLAGDNKQGKSSFLDAIRQVVKLDNTTAVPEPIHQGEDYAISEIVSEATGRRYVREWKRSRNGNVTSTASVYALDGAKYQNPAQLLAEDIGAEIIDAGEFARMKDKEQLETLLRHVDLPFDLSELKAQKAGAEERRKIAGREVDRLKGALGSLAKPAEDAPTEEVSSSALIAELDVAQAANRKRSAAWAEYSSAADEVGRLDEQIAELQRRREETAARQEVALGEFNALTEVDLEPIQERLRNLDAINASVRARKAYDATAAELEKAQAVWQKEQDALAEIDKRKREGLDAASFPDPLLSFNDDGVIYDGVPFGQLNDADKQIVGALILVGASDRKLRIGFVKDGDLLDDQNVERLRKVAVDADYTFIVERGRDNSRSIGYTFTGGTLTLVVEES